MRSEFANQLRLRTTRFGIRCSNFALTATKSVTPNVAVNPTQIGNELENTGRQIGNTATNVGNELENFGNSVANTLNPTNWW